MLNVKNRADKALHSDGNSAALQLPSMSLALVGECMEVVIQEDVTGCGIAATAALAGLIYAEARQRASALGIHVSYTSLWSDTEYVRALLRDFGISVSPKETPFEAWEQLPDKALIAIKWALKNDKPFWHWALFARENGEAKVLDSKKALKSNVPGISGASSLSGTLMCPTEKGATVRGRWSPGAICGVRSSPIQGRPCASVLGGY